MLRILHERQIEQFAEQGFFALERAIPPNAIESIRSAALGIVDEFDAEVHRTVFSTLDRDRGRDRYFMGSAEDICCFLEEDALGADGSLTRPKYLAINKIGHAMHDLSPAFQTFCQQPLFGAVLRDLGYVAPVLWQTMYIFKQPHIGGEVRWHQDATYLRTDPPCVTGVWVAIEDAHKDNGCLWMQPGGHRSPLREVYEVAPGSHEGVLRTIDDTPWPNLDQGVALEVPAGSVVFFSDHMPHYSSHNQSDQSRHAFTMHIAEKGSSWSERNWLQRPSLGDFDL